LRYVLNAEMKKNRNILQAICEEIQTDMKKIVKVLVYGEPDVITKKDSVIIKGIILKTKVSYNVHGSVF